MGNSFEAITVLQYRLKAAQEELAAFQSGEKYIRMEKTVWRRECRFRCQWMNWSGCSVLHRCCGIYWTRWDVGEDRERCVLYFCCIGRSELIQ